MHLFVIVRLFSPINLDDFQRRTHNCLTFVSFTFDLNGLRVRSLFRNIFMLEERRKMATKQHAIVHFVYSD